MFLLKQYLDPLNSDLRYAPCFLKKNRHFLGLLKSIPKGCIKTIAPLFFVVTTPANYSHTGIIAILALYKKTA
jgi:hypothetical protein